jgi:hypothetical protein
MPSARNLPQQNSLRCATCGRRWNAEPSRATVRAMLIWQVDDQQHVTDLKLVCKSPHCDGPAYRDWASEELARFAGVEAAWEGLETLFRSCRWPARPRRRLFALMRDASRLGWPADQPRGAVPRAPRLRPT